MATFTVSPSRPREVLLPPPDGATIFAQTGRTGGLGAQWCSSCGRVWGHTRTGAVRTLDRAASGGSGCGQRRGRTDREGGPTGYDRHEQTRPPGLSRPVGGRSLRSAKRMVRQRPEPLQAHRPGDATPRSLGPRGPAPTRGLGCRDVVRSSFLSFRPSAFAVSRVRYAPVCADIGPGRSWAREPVGVGQVVRRRHSARHAPAKEPPCPCPPRTPPAGVPRRPATSPGGDRSSSGCWPSPSAHRQTPCERCARS